MRDEEINSLIVKYIDGVASEKEAKVVDSWYQSFDASQGLLAQMSKEEIEAAANQSFKTLMATVHTKS